jgi:outer membrane protein TolC
MLRAAKGDEDRLKSTVQEAIDTALREVSKGWKIYEGFGERLKGRR